LLKVLILRHVASTLFLSSQTSPKRIESHQGNYKGKTKEITEEVVTGPCSSSASAIKEGVG